MSGIIVTIPPTVEVQPGNNASNPSSLPPVTYQYALLNYSQTWGGLQTFPLGTISIQAADVHGTILASSLPLPTPTALGGVQSVSAVSHNWIASISTSGVPSLSQPAFTDISGNIAVSQMNSGTSASSSTFWRGDGTWAAPSGTVPATAIPLIGSGAGAVGTGTKYAREDHVHPAGFNYTQLETGAVSSPVIQRLNNTLFASEFGAVGDNTTNDATALQNFLNAVATTGKEGRFDPHKSYFVSGADLSLSVASGIKSAALYGFGSQIRTDPTQIRIGFTVSTAAAVTRADEARRVLIEGLNLSQFQDANAQWGFKIPGSNFVTLRNCFVYCGSDTATVPSTNYAAFYVLQSNPLNVDTGSQVCLLEDCGVKGATTSTPVGFRIDGQCNGSRIQNAMITNATKGVFLARPSTGLNVNEATLANGVTVSDCIISGCTDAIYVLGTTGYSVLDGFVAQNNRIESVTNVFNYANGMTLNTTDGNYPIFRGNSLFQPITSALINTNNLIVCFEGAWIPYTPTITSTGGTLTTVSATGGYTISGKVVTFSVQITLTTVGTGTGKLNLPLPIGAAKRVLVANAVDASVTGKSGSYVVGAGSSTGTIAAYDNATSLLNNGAAIIVSGSYELS